MNPRIAFTGASGTGKTTLAKALADRLGLELQPSFAREVAAEMGLASPYEVDALGRRDEFQQRVLERTLGWQVARLGVGFVADRSLWDALTYTALHSDAAVLDAGFSLAHRTLDAAGFSPSQFYSRVVLCPMESLFVLGDDIARRQDQAYHRRYERILVQFLEGSGVKIDRSLMRIPAGRRTEWISGVVESVAPVPG